MCIRDRDNEAAALRVLALAAERQADMILITGSLYMLGEVRHFLLEKLTTTTKQPTTGEAE